MHENLSCMHDGWPIGNQFFYSQVKEFRQMIDVLWQKYLHLDRQTPDQLFSLINYYSSTQFVTIFQSLH